MKKHCRKGNAFGDVNMMCKKRDDGKGEDRMKKMRSENDGRETGTVGLTRKRDSAGLEFLHGQTNLLKYE